MVLREMGAPFVLAEIITEPYMFTADYLIVPTFFFVLIPLMMGCFKVKKRVGGIETLTDE